MQMQPGSSFAGVDGVFYSASKGVQDVPAPAIRQALMFGWTPIDGDHVVLAPNLTISPPAPAKPFQLSEADWNALQARVAALESR